MRALVRIRPEPHYRRAAFEAGLRRVGFAIYDKPFTPLGPEDWLILWNRKRGADEIEADAWEARGGTVIVTENAYLQKVDKTMYAISVHGHNGSGWYPIGTEDRFSALGFPLKPWRTVESMRLVCGQRSIGSSTMASPPQWGEKLAAKFKTMGVPHRFRPHPGNFAPKVPLVKDLADASVCSIWSSAAGVMALIEGVGVHYSAPRWICAGAGENWREEPLNRMAHGQWSVTEIESGEPFARIIEHRKEAVW